MKLCVVCEMPMDARRQKTCGELCSREWQRRYYRQYHQEHLEERRASCRASWARHNEKRGRPPRKPQTPEQHAARLERQRKIRATPEWKAKERQKRLNWTPEQKARHLEQKRKAHGKKKKVNAIKRRERHMRDPEHRNEYQRKYVKRNILAYQVLKSLGIEIDIETMEPSNA
ncbi:hypothetical protein RPMA_18155 [Tardiphaga alba]|uniref:Uncharacterized protein n=1 Tax=Tardiphaga alba TaxID=340268 RepID=A0ABX8AC45_9BRAD|nr:hypothetical protein [Tardiphaga alba]QUS40541.1 hypothetical protein RPMA_18155 [Tardiphaga alba]